VYDLIEGFAVKYTVHNQFAVHHFAKN